MSVRTIFETRRDPISGLIWFSMSVCALFGCVGPLSQICVAKLPDRLFFTIRDPIFLRIDTISNFT